MARGKLGWAAWVAGWSFKLGFAAVALLLPLSGVWIASSLAAHHDGPLWASLVAGALCFPVLPLAWDLVAGWRRSRAGAPRPRVLTGFDRLLLRTLAVNVVFVGGLLAVFPASTYEALSTRGDWMLRGSQASWANSTRSTLFGVAERMQWLHEATHENAYEDLIDPSLTQTKDGTAPEAGRTLDRTTPSTPAVSPDDLLRADGWPFAPTLHPLVASMPSEAETSIESVARYIVDNEADPVQRVKALHDYVASRVAYDVPALEADRFPPQDAAAVFSRGTAVCAGYAALLAALGDAAGIEIVVVVGDARDSDGLFDGRGHAWNAINIDGKWFLVDATWDAGHVSGSGFVEDYDAGYFMTPPEVFVASHMPDDPKWQLLPAALSHGDFLRQPHLRPSFAALGLELVEPRRARHDVRQGDQLTLNFTNPNGFALSGSVRSTDDGDSSHRRCKTNQERTTMVCTFDDPGRRLIALFGPEGAFLGQIYVDVQ
ncbi:MAG: transglutaminase [Deltaproteobacteria bacterium]|nr:transglutaminase [Deltaproteobacteria bacterium]